MSMEMHVLFAGKLPTKAALQRAMKELGYALSIKPPGGSLEQQRGFMPMRLAREETGIEFNVFEGRAAVEELAIEGLDPSFDRLASFRWGGDETEAIVGPCAAAALAKITGGAVFDEAEGKLLSVAEAIAVARQSLDAFAKSADAQRGGTRPTDIRRYLKPLLKQRSDLALVGRMLIIRPVRHLLRGAFFDRTSDKYEFRVWLYINPLYENVVGVGYGRSIHDTAWRVWEPHFEPLLFDTLAEDIFDHVGKITTLDDFAREVEGNERFQEARVKALVLSGERERAVQAVDEIEQSRGDIPYWQAWVREQRAFLERPTADVLTKFRAKEAENVAELKLAKFWEQAPFPAALPEAKRVTCAEPAFVTTPWISRPAELLREVPEEPGDVRFAKGTLFRKGRVIMFVPLTRQEAEKAHRNREGYTLAARLADRSLLLLTHRTRWSPHDPVQPANPDYVPRRTIYLDVQGSSGRLYAWSSEDFDDDDILKMRSVQIYGTARRNMIWKSSVTLKERRKTVHDSRSGETAYASSPMNDTDVSLCSFPMPSFGAYDDLLQRVRTYLRNEGFGEFN